MKLQHFQTSFEFGETSPRLLARIDLNSYNKAVKTQENAYTLIHGGATKRRGTLYVGALKSESQAARLIPFVYSATTRFTLVLNGGVVQFLKNGSFVTLSGNRYELALPYTASQLKDVQYAQSGSTMYLVHPSHAPKILQRVTDTAWTLTDIPFTYNAVSDVVFSNAFITFKIINGSNAFQMGDGFIISTSVGAISTISALIPLLTPKAAVTVATTGELTALSGLLTVDSRILVAGDRVLVKDQSNTALNGIYIVASGAWTRAVDADTGAELTNVVVRSSAGSVNSGYYWKQTNTIASLGSTAQNWSQGSAPANGTIAGIASMPSSTTTENWAIICTLASANRQEWSVIGSVSGSTAAYWKTGNYPQTVAFFEQRLFFGGSAMYPQHIWGSCAGDYLNFTVGNKDADGVIVQIAGNDYNTLTHMVSARSLMPLTSSTEFSLSGPNNYAISGISSNIVKDHTRNGSNHLKPLRIGKEVVFSQRDGKKLRAISYSVTEDANVAPDITLFSEHLTRSATFVDMSFAADPDYIAWIVLSDGQLCSLTLDRDHDTVAWARHKTDGHFENVCAVSGESYDDVYLVTRRLINGVTRRFVELFDYEEIDTVYCDAAAIYSGVPTTAISGLSHLEGKTVTAVADGTVHPSMVVTGGTITMQRPASYVTVGLPFTTTVELLNPEFGDATQSSQGKAVSVTEIIARFHDTINVNINDVPIPFRSNTMGLDSKIELFTGDKKISNLGWRSPFNIKITSDTPTPMTLLGVIIKAVVNG